MTGHIDDSAESLFFKGNELLEQGELAQAERCFRAALQLAPGMAEAHANLAYCLDQRGAGEQAVISYQHAIALAPRIAGIYLNYGSLLTTLERLDEAIAAFQQAIALAPEDPAPWSNLGGLYAAMHSNELAESCCRQALVLDAGFAKASFNLAYVLLRQGRFEEGWRRLEARDWYASLERHLPYPRWQGESLQGKSLFIGFEAGHGDMIQFCRYVPLLKRQGVERIGLLCHPALKSLLATLDGLDQVMAFDQPLPGDNWDYWTPLLSIPFYCQTRLDSIPAAIPYLQAQPDRVAYWREQLPQSGLRLGLVWRGSPQFENDGHRSLSDLELLRPLWQVQGVQFISLQKGQGEDQASQPPPGMVLLNLGSQLQDFSDTAALLQNLDLVISVDTAVAHLAAALGQPCWLLLPAYKTDWRWLENRVDSPWYPGVMQLFRQTTPGNWASVVQDLAQALEAFAQNWTGRAAP